VLRLLGLHPRSQVLVSRVVHHAVRLVACNVEIDLASGLLTLGKSGRVDALRCGDLVQGSVCLTARGTRVQIRHDRDDGAVDGFIGGGGFPESSLHRIGDVIGAGSKVADGPPLNDVTVGEGCLGAQSVGAGTATFIRSGSRCARDADGSRGD
jgi:hypothetical protein